MIIAETFRESPWGAFIGGHARWRKAQISLFEKYEENRQHQAEESRQVIPLNGLAFECEHHDNRKNSK